MARAQHFESRRWTAGTRSSAGTSSAEGKKTLFADKRVRQAMTMLADRERMAKELYRGYAIVAKGTFSAQSQQSDPAVKPLPYDPQHAKALLKEAGF